MEVLKAERRKILGKKVKKLRKKGLLPAVIFGRDLKSIPISLDTQAFRTIYAQAGESTLVDLSLDGKNPQKVLISDVTIDPISDDFLHANLHQIDLAEEITTEIPLHIVGQSPVVESGEGILLSLLSEIEITCLPQNLPSEINVDISGLEKIDDAIAVKELAVDLTKIKINADPEELVLKIDYAQMEEEIEEKVAEEELVSEVEVEKEKKEVEDEQISEIKDKETKREAKEKQ